MANEVDALKQAMADYKKAYGQNPRYRRVLGLLDVAMNESTRLHPEKTTSPGERAAFQAATGKPIPPASTVPPPQEAAGASTPSRSGHPDGQPKDYTSARQMAAARLAQGGEVAA